MRLPQGRSINQKNAQRHHEKAVPAAHVDSVGTTMPVHFRTSSVTGMVNCAPWQAEGEAVLILAAPGRVRSTEVFAAIVVDVIGAGVNVTPVGAQPGCAASAAMGPLAVTLWIATPCGFGLVMRRTTSADPPGTRLVCRVSPGTSASTVTVCMVPLVADPLPKPVAVQ